MRRLTDEGRVRRLMARLGAIDVEPEKLRDLFNAVEPRMHRYPAVDPSPFRCALEETLRG